MRSGKYRPNGGTWAANHRRGGRLGASPIGHLPEPPTNGVKSGLSHSIHRQYLHPGLRFN
ncbi:hypothetical protein E2C01_066529 [Portunus trituberculatus]|uniref:Uncharacterized protein n=1 Tax=Portunus trituberculatus TaxID=210409 RepID=A0A5B7HHC2_PORTR|nr:hypothetical protein [Portunus trituberculatus]